MYVYLGTINVKLFCIHIFYLQNQSLIHVGTCNWVLTRK